MRCAYPITIFNTYQKMGGRESWHTYVERDALNSGQMARLESTDSMQDWSEVSKTYKEIILECLIALELGPDETG